MPTPPISLSERPLERGPIRRRVRRTATEGTRATFVTKSFSRDDGTLYHPSLDTQTGTFFCDCPDYRYRGSFCKHLRRAAAQLGIKPPDQQPPQQPAQQPPEPIPQHPTHPTTQPPIESPMHRPFFDEQILQLLPAPPRARAQFADGGEDELVWCFALLRANSEKGRPETQFQLVVPMIQRHGCLELACDLDRPYERLVYPRRANAEWERRNKGTEEF